MSGSVLQSGAVTPGHVVAWGGNGTVVDGGGASTGGPFLPLTGGNVTGKIQVGSMGWLEPIIPGTETNSLFVSLSNTANSAGVFATETVEAGIPGGESAWSIGAFALNNNASTVQTVWGIYMESRRTGGAGTTQGIELHGINGGNTMQSQPYFMGQSGSVLGLWVTAGRNDATVPINNNPGVAMGVLGSGASWDRGIMFGAGSVHAATDGVGAVAVGMPPAYTLAWYVNDAGASRGVGQVGAFITSRVTTVPTNPSALIFGDTGLSFDPGNAVDAMLLSAGLNTFQKTHITDKLTVDAGIGVWGIGAPGARPTFIGNKGGNTALASVISILASYGFGIDGTT